MTEKPTRLSQSAIEHWGETLHRALVDRAPVDPLTTVFPDMSIEDAYAIQLATIERRMAAERARIIGWKIGVTSKPVQDMLDVRQPDFGHLLSSMVCDDGGTIAMDNMIAPRVEGEIAFLLKKDLAGPGVAAADVLAATECVMPCLEIVDSRIRDWKIRIQDTVADNASSGMIVVGGAIADPRKIDLALIGMTLRKNGDVVGSGAGAAALGHPLNAIAWLGNTLGHLGITMRAGEVVLSGALSALVPAEEGDNLSMALGGIGSASVQFVKGGAHGA